MLENEVSSSYGRHPSRLSSRSPYDSRLHRAGREGSILRALGEVTKGETAIPEGPPKSSLARTE
jgi:hypothetical protein